MGSQGGTSILPPLQIPVPTTVTRRLHWSSVRITVSPVLRSHRLPSHNPPLQPRTTLCEGEKKPRTLLVSSRRPLPFGRSSISGRCVSGPRVWDHVRVAAPGVAKGPSDSGGKVPGTWLSSPQSVDSPLCLFRAPRRRLSPKGPTNLLGSGDLDALTDWTRGTFTPRHNPILVYKVQRLGRLRDL